MNSGCCHQLLEGMLSSTNKTALKTSLATKLWEILKDSVKLISRWGFYKKGTGIVDAHCAYKFWAVCLFSVILKCCL